MAGAEFGRLIRNAYPTPQARSGRAVTGVLAVLALTAGASALPPTAARAAVPAAQAAVPRTVPAPHELAARTQTGLTGRYAAPPGPEGEQQPLPLETVDPPDATPTPGDPPPTATPSPADPPPSTAPPTDPPPTSTASPPPDPPGPVPTRTARPDPGTGNQSRRGLSVTTGDLTLPAAYWHQPSTLVELGVTVTNTGDAPEMVRLRYRLPAGLTDAGTRGCASTGAGAYQCGAWHAPAGARFSAQVRVRVDGNAWRRLPLSGSVEVSAGQFEPGRNEVTDSEGFAVLFPPGPPVAGMSLTASDVGFDITGAPNPLTIRLGNTGAVDSTGAVEVVLPPGITIPTLPAGCRATAADRTVCELGRIPAGTERELRLPMAGSPEAQQSAPLSGAIAGSLTAGNGRKRQMWMSFRIVAAAALATPASMASTGPVGSQGVLVGADPRARQPEGLTGSQRTAIGLIAVSGLLVVLAVALAVTSWRRRMAEDEAAQGTPAVAD